MVRLGRRMRRRGGRRRKGFGGRKVIGNRVRGADRKFIKRRGFRSRGKVRNGVETATWTTRMDSLVTANTVLSRTAIPALNTYVPQDLVVEVPYPANYSTLYKQWKLYKIITYIRMRMKEGPVGHDASLSADAAGPGYNSSDVAVTPVDWQVYYMATKQPDAVFNADTILLSGNRVMISSKQHKFVTSPMVTWNREYVSLGNITQTIKKATPASWSDFSALASPPRIAYKIGQVLNASQYVCPDSSHPPEFTPACIIETYTTFVYQFRWRKALSVNDTSGGTDAMAPGKAALFASFDTALPGVHTLTSTTTPPGAG